MQKLVELFKDESGAAAMEYCALVMVITMSIFMVLLKQSFIIFGGFEEWFPAIETRPH